MQQLGARIRKLRPGSIILPLEREGAWGACHWQKNWNARSPAHAPHKAPASIPAINCLAEISLSDFGKYSPTERRNPRSRHLDKLSVGPRIKLMLSEDAKNPAGHPARTKKYRTGRRLHRPRFQNKAAGCSTSAPATSGRLGRFGCQRMSPTFRTPPELVQGIIAGGQTALWRSVEGAEDDPLAACGRLNVVRHPEGRRRGHHRPAGARRLSGERWRKPAGAGQKPSCSVFNPFLKVPARARPLSVSRRTSAPKFSPVRPA